jgi:hypothetical protein
MVHLRINGETRRRPCNAIFAATGVRVRRWPIDAAMLARA